MSETMNIYAEKGAKVVFLNRNGRDHEPADARKHGLTEGAIYTVERTEVGGWHTDVYLQEFPDKSFNSVMFGDYKPVSMEFKRITPEQVLAAYQATGLVPLQDDWVAIDGTQKCACGLSAVFIHQVEGGEQILFNSTHLDDLMETHLGIKGGYICGFISGFDGSNLRESDSDMFKAGFGDGLASWEAVKQLAVYDE